MLNAILQPRFDCQNEKQTYFIYIFLMIDFKLFNK
jgi:hypothetical protein